MMVAPIVSMSNVCFKDDDARNDDLTSEALGSAA